MLLYFNKLSKNMRSTKKVILNKSKRKNYKFPKKKITQRFNQMLWVGMWCQYMTLFRLVLRRFNKLTIHCMLFLKAQLMITKQNQQNLNKQQMILKVSGLVYLQQQVVLQSLVYSYYQVLLQEGWLRLPLLPFLLAFWPLLPLGLRRTQNIMVTSLMRRLLNMIMLLKD